MDQPWPEPHNVKPVSGTIGSQLVASVMMGVTWKLVDWVERHGKSEGRGREK